MQNTPVDQIASIHSKAKDSFKAGVSRTLEFRRHQLLQLARLVQENADLIRDALRADLHKQKFEVDVTELAPIGRSPAATTYICD
jgi:aldehyde dehydrogenase (NAD+)